MGISAADDESAPDELCQGTTDFAVLTSAALRVEFLSQHVHPLTSATST